MDQKTSGGQGDSGKQDYRFVRENVKKQKLWEKKILRRAAASIGCGLLFGAAAALVLAYVYPKIAPKEETPGITQITIPEVEGEGIPEIEPETSEHETVIITETADFTLSDYTKLYARMRAVARTAEEFMVTVTAGSSDLDLFLAEVETENQQSGLLVGDNGIELLILTSYEGISSADRLRVTFASGENADAVLKKYDPVTDLAVISISMAGFDAHFLEGLTYAQWGSTDSVWAGQPVIAIGNPAGTIGSIMCGNLTSTFQEAIAVDGNYRLLQTDMSRSTKGGGVLINLDGAVIGWTQDKYLNQNNKNTLTAYNLTDIREIIEHLCNNQDIVYFGIKGSAVTDELTEEEDVPRGVYVLSVEWNSPAMAAGIQSGDIITKINGQAVSTQADIHSMLLNYSAGQTISVDIMRLGKNDLTPISCEVALGTKQ